MYLTEESQIFRVSLNLGAVDRIIVKPGREPLASRHDDEFSVTKTELMFILESP